MNDISKEYFKLFMQKHYIESTDGYMIVSPRFAKFLKDNYMLDIMPEALSIQENFCFNTPKNSKPHKIDNIKKEKEYYLDDIRIPPPSKTLYDFNRDYWLNGEAALEFNPHSKPECFEHFGLEVEWRHGNIGSIPYTQLYYKHDNSSTDLLNFKFGHSDIEALNTELKDKRNKDQKQKFDEYWNKRKLVLNSMVLCQTSQSLFKNFHYNTYY